MYQIVSNSAAAELVGKSLTVYRFIRRKKHLYIYNFIRSKKPQLICTRTELQYCCRRGWPKLRPRWHCR